MSDRLKEIEAMLADNEPVDHFSKGDIRYLLDRVRELQAERTDLRQAIVRAAQIAHKGEA